MNETPYVPWEASSTLTDPYPDSEWLALDIETTGLNWLDDKLVLIALSNGTSAYLIDVRQHSRESIGTWLREELYPRHKLIIHNALFDLSWLFDYSGPSTVQTFDTMVQQQLLQAGHFGPESLADCVEHYFRTELNKDLQTSFDSAILSDDQLRYAALDAYWTWQLKHQQATRLERQGLATVSYIEQMATPVFAAMRSVGLGVDEEVHATVIAEYAKQAEAHGMAIIDALGEYHARRQWSIIEKVREVHDLWQSSYDRNRAEWERQWQENQERWEREGGLLGAAVGDDFPHWWSAHRFHDQTLQKKYQEPMGLRRYRSMKERAWKQNNPEPEKPAEQITPLNPNSRHHMLPILEEIGVPLPSYKGEDIAAARMKTRKREHQRLLQTILDYKSNDKAVNTYGARFLARRWSDGRFHPEYRQMVSSGRPASSGPNVNQIKRGPLRRVIVPDEGHLFIAADYSQMELRLLAELTGDPQMIQAFVDGQDIHTHAAVTVFGVETPDGEQRSAAKTVNFGIAYGMGPRALQMNLMEQGIYLTIKECARIIEGWKENYSTAWVGIEGWRDHAVEERWVATAFGRKRWFARDLQDDSVRREGGNHVIQGSNADITKIAIARAQRDLIPLGGSVVMNIYDEIVATVPEAHAEEGRFIVSNAMIQAAEMVLTRVPVVVDPIISRSWSEEDAV